MADCVIGCGTCFWYKKLRNVGEDLGGAVKGFKKGMQDGEEKAALSQQESTTVDVKAKEKAE